ncbi:MAG: FISUMP domain-containing protein [Dysgonamonadaceae bacterium]|nr:FISUMP domain-containing protein [Dysgonamonadaceae bacterium]
MNKFKLLQLIVLLVLMGWGCSKDNYYNKEKGTIPVVTTSPVTDITSITAKGGGNVTDDGGALVLSRGICWSINENPTLNDSKSEEGSGKGSFTRNLSGLNSDTRFYVRAYATNSAGTSYGNIVFFNTLPTDAVNKKLPEVSTGAALLITAVGATLSGNVFSTGNSQISDKGVVYSMSENPTINDSKISAGTGDGGFSLSVTNLFPNTKYYFKAFAINEIGTSFGGQISFITLQQEVLSTVNTAIVSDITSKSAVCWGEVASDGYSSVSERGIVYSTLQNPTVSDSKIPSGSGKGAYNLILSGLSPKTTYYVRAYAVNKVGISYGNMEIFTTLHQDPQYPGTSLSPVKIGNVWWAPINAGYDSNHKYGLLYQWHRKYGQGYDSENSTPELKDTQVDLIIGNDIVNKNVFFLTTSFKNNWCTTYYNSWEMSVINNPCPEGWRVPNNVDLIALNSTGSTWTDAGGADNLPGRWYGYDHSSAKTYSIFLPAGGTRWYDGEATLRNTHGFYWSNLAPYGYASMLFFIKDRYSMSEDDRISGHSVRCVHD